MSECVWVFSWIKTNLLLYYFFFFDVQWKSQKHWGELWEIFFIHKKIIKNEFSQFSHISFTTTVSYFVQFFIPTTIIFELTFIRVIKESITFPWLLWWWKFAKILLKLKKIHSFIKWTFHFHQKLRQFSSNSLLIWLSFENVQTLFSA